ncbi:uncharacterized protein ALTATR162_LOCUS499 [Alternaria atra]|uniref:Uncharacterized protein n=1 Tax=Alternaria atra TaxID=119953 RepID=A0A8J2HRL0_9PLEO|nr:uncharacterized protein ALTATR162_LOCUS499 [Alternaria atra]CAG5139483.1 unnamed protein product [Alternaria atra]
MTPRTRSSNRDADYKVYYSKKVPQQIHFPHKRKTVRRRSTPVEDGKRQMIFLPEKMKKRKTPVVADSDEDSDGELEEYLDDGGVPIQPQVDEEEEQHPGRKMKGKGKKRSSGIIPHSHGDEESVEPTSKRRRTVVSPKDHRRSKRVATDADDENDVKTSKTNRERTLRRQSTMTQLFDGRKPLPGLEEPGFKPIKQNSRLSWSGRGKSDKAMNDRKQRTLTQMIPRMRTEEIVSDEDIDEVFSDVEAEQQDSQTYGDAVAQRLARQGLYRVEGNGTKDHDSTSENAEDKQQDLEDKAIKKEPTENSQDTADLVVQSVEDEMDEDCEDSYKPTQFIEAPATRATRAARRGNNPQATETGGAFYAPQSLRKGKARFSLLSTPEKRRIREIPSSQSPADSPLSTQVSPQKLHQSPLKMCSGNPMNVPETPSRRKQVTFKMPSKTPVPPPTLRKFESTIQDSEDEDEGLIEEDLPSSRRRGTEDAQPFSSRPEAATGKVVGADTQAMLDRIDKVCADANGEDVMGESGSSQGSDYLPTLRGHNEPSPELGEPHKSSNGKSSSYSTNSVVVKQEPGYDDDDDDDEDATILPTAPVDLLHEARPIASDATTTIEGELPLQTEELRSTPPVIEGYNEYTCPSTPMVINNDSSSEEDSPTPDPTPPQSTRRPEPQPPSTSIQQSVDLDDSAIQVPPLHPKAFNIYVPTVFENYVADLQVDGVNLKCALCDTAGQRDYDRFRPLSYSQTDIFCICFSIDDSDSLDNIEEQWYPEIEQYERKKDPVFLLGFEEDFRQDPKTIEKLGKNNRVSLTMMKGEEMAKNIGALKYFECSAIRHQGTKEIFDTIHSMVLVASPQLKKRCKSGNWRMETISVLQSS